MVTSASILLIHLKVFLMLKNVALYLTVLAFLEVLSGCSSVPTEVESNGIESPQVTETSPEPVQWTPSLIFPVEEGRITDTFEKVRGEARIHQGVDIAKGPMAKIYSAESGKVIYRGYEPGYGNYIIVRHKEGWTTRYAHLAQYNVDWGESVQKGQIVGFMGETGRVTGVHLHFELRHNKMPKDPLKFMAPMGMLTIKDFFGVPVPLRNKMTSNERLRSAYINGPRVYLYY